MGPILVDFALATEIKGNFKDDGLFLIEIQEEHIMATIAAGYGFIGEFTGGCPMVPGFPHILPRRMGTDIEM